MTVSTQNTGASVTTDKDDVFDRTVYIKPDVKERPRNEIDYSSQNGPKLKYLWCRTDLDEPNDESSSLLAGQTLFLGADVGSDGKIYFIPGHAPRVLQLDPETDELRQIGPSFHGKFKFLRSITVGDVIFGLPCHADSVLRIHVPTETVSLIPIPYEEFFAEEGNPQLARQQRHQEWKYHGGNLCPIDHCIYAIPQSATHVLKIDPVTSTCSLIGPSFPGRWKWYGGLLGKTDGAIYGVPQNAGHVLRIHPNDGVTLHGSFGDGGHKWHGASTAPDGTIVCVPSNADSVLCVQPPTVKQGEKPEPLLYELGDSSVIKTGRHRRDKKYKFLGGMAGSDGKVYIFPSGAEHVLQVDTQQKQIQNVGPNIYEQKLEEMCQNKWQNGILSHFDKSVYGIPLASNSLLQIDTSRSNPKVSTWQLPSPCRSLAKFEGAIVAPNGIIYTVPNNFKAVLRIQPFGWSAEAVKRNEQDPHQHQNAVYKSGIATLRSSAHRVKYAPKNRKHDPQPRNSEGKLTKTLWLPPTLCKEAVFSYDGAQIDLVGAVRSLLTRCDPNIVGRFRMSESSGSGGSCMPALEDFVVPVPSTWRSVNGGQCESAQKYLSDQVVQDEEFLSMFDRLVKEVVLPHLKKRLVSVEPAPDEPGSVTFYTQRPPTLRLQPGPAWATVKPHNDAEYGHQNGELNFWLPLTDSTKTGVDLWCESEYNVGDFHPISAKVHEIISFHGSSCRHYVNANTSHNTRVSLDFRVGVQGFFDPTWQMRGTTDDHGRLEVTL
ncbi:hypothetical protein ACA910_017785 [Epithemia clementina (nom. ined.)]